MLSKNQSVDLKRPAWAQEGFELLLTERRFHASNTDKFVRKIRHQEIRRVLFHRLWFESPEFRRDFSSYVRSTFDGALSTYRNFLRCRREFILQRLSDLERFPMRNWNNKGPGDHLDAYKYFAQFNSPVRCN